MPDYYEYYQLWLYIEGLTDCTDNWYKFLDEELCDGEGM